MYAVLETGSKQYRVAAGDKLEIERLDTEAGKSFTFDKVLLVSNDGKVITGWGSMAKDHDRAEAVIAQLNQEHGEVEGDVHCREHPHVLNRQRPHGGRLEIRDRQQRDHLARQGRPEPEV